jgi:hypothetical protein
MSMSTSAKKSCGYALSGEFAHYGLSTVSTAMLSNTLYSSSRGVKEKWPLESNFRISLKRMKRIL